MDSTLVLWTFVTVTVPVLQATFVTGVDIGVMTVLTIERVIEPVSIVAVNGVLTTWALDVVMLTTVFLVVSVRTVITIGISFDLSVHNYVKGMNYAFTV
jgi:hypothetical protein